mmetsp:Transcript_14616/g.22568  ORF Transcript_14616/g.22568 Transcript_14616/m.22568 type:complete len:372 (+) Transcript_14616:42-1157(+)
MSTMVNPLFNSTSNEVPTFLTISFADDPKASLGAQLSNRDKGELCDMFVPAYATIGRLLEGETIARASGVQIDDAIVAVNGEGFRRFPAEHFDEADGALDETAKNFKTKVHSGKDGEGYAALLGKIKSVKAAADAAKPLELSLERYGWDEPANAWERFLLARDGDVPKAMAMRQAHDAWKASTFPIDLTDGGVQSIMSSKAVCELDIGSEGSPPCVYVDFGKLQALDWSADSVNSVVKSFVVMTETILAKSAGRRHPKAAQFIDLSGVSITSGFRSDILKKVYAAFEPNYPETLHRMVMYPVSKMMARTASVLLSFVNEKTSSKFVITDSIEVVCKELGWSQEEVEAAGGVNEFIEKHKLVADDLILAECK